MGGDLAFGVTECGSVAANFPPETPADMLGARLGALLGGRVDGRLPLSHSDGEGGVSIESVSAMEGGGTTTTTTRGWRMWVKTNDQFMKAIVKNYGNKTIRVVM